MEEKRHTSLHYDQELQEIKNDLIYLGVLTEKAIQQAMSSLSDRNSDIARKVIGEDNDIDRLDTDIEERCIKILALRQPAAIDLRFITTAIKITGHLERIGDMAVNIAEKVRQTEQVVDDLNEQIFRELLTFMMEDSASIHRALLIMQVSKNMERIADHAKGIADMVAYMVTGLCVRHQTRPANE